MARIEVAIEVPFHFVAWRKVSKQVPQRASEVEEDDFGFVKVRDGV